MVATRRAPTSERLSLIWLMGLAVLLPVEFLPFPLNSTAFDLWLLAGLPVIVLSLRSSDRLPGLIYLLPMWLILTASLVSTYAAVAPQAALAVIVKEVHVFVWFFVVATALGRLSLGGWRLFLRVWTWTALAHAGLILLQFLLPSFWLWYTSAASWTDFYLYRPSGFFTNPNWAAFYQLLAFVPLVLQRPSKRLVTVAAPVLLASMLVAGSMGALLALSVGAVVALIALIATGQARAVATVSVRVSLVVAVLAGGLTLVMRESPAYQQRLEDILVGRADRSSEGRFHLWERGLGMLVERRAYLVGVGPENFRYLDRHGKQLHSDPLAFAVERGLTGILGLGLFIGIAGFRAAALLARFRGRPEAGAITVVFIAALFAAVVESSTHQLFHFRGLWLVLALQEAALIRTAGVRALTVQRGAVLPPTLAAGLSRPSLLGRLPPSFEK